MMLRSTATSPFGRKVKIAAIHLGLMQRMTVEPADPLDADDPVRAENPLGKMPVMSLDDGRRLYDSRVILEYLDHLAGGGRLLPRDVDDRLAALTQQALGDGIMDAGILIVYEGRYRPEAIRHEPWLDYQRGKVERGIAALAADPPDPTRSRSARSPAPARSATSTGASRRTGAGRMPRSCAGSTPSAPRHPPSTRRPLHINKQSSEETLMRAWVAGLALACSLVVAPLAAQTYPDHPIRLIVVFPAGGPSDVIARVVSQSMARTLGQAFVVDNRGGAGGVVGTDVVAKAAPDGYTLALTSAGALAISPSLQTMPYRPMVDLQPVGLVAKVPELLVVNAHSPARTVKDLVALAKAKPGALNFVSSGPGTMPQLASEMLKAAAGLDIVHVPFAGAAPAVTELLAGRGDFAFFDIPILLGNVKSDALRALAIGSQTRFPGLPDTPTMAEAGYPSVVAENWYGLVAPPKTPPAVVAKLNEALAAAARDPQIVETLRAQGVVLAADTPDAFAAFLNAEMKKWADVVREAGVKIE